MKLLILLLVAVIGVVSVFAVYQNMEINTLNTQYDWAMEMAHMNKGEQAAVVEKVHEQEIII